MSYIGKSVMFGGSMDVPTLGHLDVIRKAINMFEKVLTVGLKIKIQ